MTGAGGGGGEDACFGSRTRRATESFEKLNSAPLPPFSVSTHGEGEGTLTTTATTVDLLLYKAAYLGNELNDSISLLK